MNSVHVSDIALQNVFDRMKANLKTYEDTGIRLYDDTADVEMRSIWALDELIQNELEYYRRIYREKGLKGLIEELLG